MPLTLNFSVRFKLIWNLLKNRSWIFYGAFTCMLSELNSSQPYLFFFPCPVIHSPTRNLTTIASICLSPLSLSHNDSSPKSFLNVFLTLWCLLYILFSFTCAITVVFCWGPCFRPCLFATFHPPHYHQRDVWMSFKHLKTLQCPLLHYLWLTSFRVKICGLLHDMKIICDVTLHICKCVCFSV